MMLFQRIISHMSFWLYGRKIGMLYFDPNPNSIEFFDIADEIFCNCEMFEPESKQNEKYNAIWLKNSVKKTLLKM